MGHFYTPNGLPAYYQPKQKGNGMRPTNIRDARRLKLVPSVTEILKVADKPALNDWRVKQAYLHALTTPPIEGETPDAYMKRCQRNARDELDATSDQGANIHDALEAYFSNGIYSTKWQPWVDSVIDYMENLFEFQLDIDDWVAEKSFATGGPDQQGYGGKVDLYSPERGIIMDWKTKSWKPGKEPKGYVENAMQLAAYRNGLDMSIGARLINLFINREDPNLICHHEWGYDAYPAFHHLKSYWYLTKEL